tara:strand:+ start:4297 stop:4962 length:666 start_codon:yes stop_codon:yes gene_type:complete
MKTKLTTILTILFALSAYPALAQNETNVVLPGPVDPTAADPAKPEPVKPIAEAEKAPKTYTANFMSTGKLRGAPVKDLGGEKIGTLTEFVFDSDDGRLHFGVVEAGGFLGLGEKHYLIPWKSFNVVENLEVEGELHLNLDATKDKMENGFEFNATEVDTIEAHQVYAYWGVTLEGEAMKAGPQSPESEITIEQEPEVEPQPEAELEVEADTEVDVEEIDET